MSVVGKSGGGLGGMSLKRAPQGPPRIIAPRAVRREPHQQIIEEYLCAILHHEREPLVARFSQIAGYRWLSLMRALGVVKCQLALVLLALRSCSQAAISSMRVCFGDAAVEALGR
jgi:hypothetical protein